MEPTSAPILSHASNSAVVHMPGRAFPGVVVQGDSLSLLYIRVKLAYEHLDPKSPRLDVEEGFDKLKDTLLSLRSLLEHYYAVIEQHGFPSLPVAPLPFDPDDED